MRKFFAAFVLVALCALPAFGADGPKGGFQGPNTGMTGGFQGPITGAKADTVKAALDLKDDSRVILTGNIVSQLKKDKFLFKDNTGEIQVEIDRKVFNRLGATVTPEMTVRIFGEVDKDWNAPTKIDVKAIEIVK